MASMSSTMVKHPQTISIDHVEEDTRVSLFGITPKQKSGRTMDLHP